MFLRELRGFTFMINAMVVYMRIWFSIIVCISFFASSQSIFAQTNDIPRPAAFVLKKAYDFLEKEEISKAINVLESFLGKGEKEITPGGPDKKGYRHHLVHFTLGNCYLMADTPSKAVSHYNAAIKEKPDFSPAWLNLAKCNYELNKYKLAGVCFLKGYDTSAEKKPEILYYSAVSFTADEDYATALEVFGRLSTAHKDQVKLEWKENIVQAYLAIDQPLKALPLIEELSEKSRGDKKKQWQEVRLYQYMNLNMNLQALEYTRLLTREYPVEPKWWKALAHLHLMENRYEKGLVALTVYGHLAPLTMEEKKLMAELNLTVGVPVQATRFYEEILSEAMDLKIVKKLAESYLYLHRHDEALQWVEKGLQKNVDEELLMLKGNLLYEKKKYNAAMEVFDSIPKGTNSGHALLMLGYSAWNAGNLDKAKHAFQMATKYPQHQKTARKLLLQLEKIGNRERS